MKSRYGAILITYPGRLIVWALSIYIAVQLWSRLPILVRWLLRIPAIEFDGCVLTVRGWNDKNFDLRAISTLSIVEDEDRGDLWIKSNGGVQARVHLRDIEGPRSLVRFLQTIEKSDS